MDQELRFITALDGVRICSSTLGNGPLLVKAPNWLSHVGIDLDSPVWGHWWAELSRHHRFVRFDQRGCSLSDWQLPEMSFESWVSDLECVVDSLQVDRFDLLGMSQGGAVAIEYAARHPDRIRRLVLFGAFARGWADGGRRRRTRLFLSLIRRGWAADNPAYRQIFTTRFISDATVAQMNWFNELQRLSTSTENAVQFQMEVGRIDVSGRLSQISAPTWSFTVATTHAFPSRKGVLSPLTIPSARFVELSSRSHILLDTDPAWTLFCAELRRFLDEDGQSKTLNSTLLLQLWRSTLPCAK